MSVRTHSRSIKKSKPIPEKFIEKEIIHYLRLKGWVAIKVRTSGRIVQGKVLSLPKDELGVSDIIACDPDGRFHAIEVKNKVGRQSDYQRRFEKEVQAKGGRYTILRSLEEVIEYVKAFYP
jgi:hypothetical protein